VLALSGRAMRTLWAVIVCALLFGPERVPLGEGTHWEIRVRLCTKANEPHVVVETRTYERLATKTGYTMRMLSQGDDGWAAVSDTRLYVTTTP